MNIDLNFPDINYKSTLILTEFQLLRRNLSNTVCNYLYYRKIGYERSESFNKIGWVRSNFEHISIKLIGMNENVDKFY
jgi:hypothetical protein